MPLQQLPQLLDLGSHAALGSTTHGRVLLHAVDDVEDLGDVAAKQGAGEGKGRGVSGERWVLLAAFTRSLPAERVREWRHSLFPRGKASGSPASALLQPGSSCLWQTRVSSQGRVRKLGAKLLWRAGEFFPVPPNRCCPSPHGAEW